MMGIQEPKSGVARGTLTGSLSGPDEHLEEKKKKFDPESFKAEILALVEGMIDGIVINYMESIENLIEEINVTNYGGSVYTGGLGIVIDGNIIHANLGAGMNTDVDNKLIADVDTDGLTTASGKIKLDVDTDHFKFTAGELQDKLDTCP